MKKLISTAILLCLMLTALAGCGGNNTETGGDSATNSNSATSSGGRVWFYE